MSNDIRTFFGLTSNSYYCLCNEEVESCLHVLRDCKLAKEVWNAILEPFDGWYFSFFECLDFD